MHGLLILPIIAYILHRMKPIRQNEAYHNFADDRSHLGIPNFNDVASNIIFVAVAVVLMIFNADPIAESEALPVFYRALFLVGPCSAYYHLAPSSETLVVDRLAMAAAFGALQAHAHGMHPILLWPTVASSMATVVYWKRTKDLRPYICLQYGGAITLLFTRQWTTLPFYALAKVCERFDGHIFGLTSGNISGHTLKHIFAAVAAAFLRP